MKDPNTEEHTNADYYQLLFQSEFSNLVTNKELSSQIFYSLLGEAKDKKIKLENGEYMDLYLCENLFSTLLPGLESLAKTSEKLIYYSNKEDEKECNIRKCKEFCKRGRGYGNSGNCVDYCGTDSAGCYVP